MAPYLGALPYRCHREFSVWLLIDFEVLDAVIVDEVLDNFPDVVGGDIRDWSWYHRSPI